MRLSSDRIGNLWRRDSTKKTHPEQKKELRSPPGALGGANGRPARRPRPRFLGALACEERVASLVGLPMPLRLTALRLVAEDPLLSPIGVPVFALPIGSADAVHARLPRGRQPGGDDQRPRNKRNTRPEHFKGKQPARMERSIHNLAGRVTQPRRLKL